MTAEPVVVVDKLNHYYGREPLRKQILFEVSTEIRAGEIVIMTGPSGSGKTTFLTLIGALRSAQEGSLRVFGNELRGASSDTLVRVRKQIGYIFQAHNLLDSLTARQNVQMSLRLHPETPRPTVRAKPVEMLRAVGLADWSEHYPNELSGGQKQRVAIARALATEPRLLLADEPTASLDKQSGRDVVELMQRLAKEQGCTVILVTHDNRILDIADRIISLEDGRLSSFAQAVISNTQQLMGTLALNNRKGELARQVQDLPLPGFLALLDQVTAESHQFLRLLELSEGEAFESMLEQVLEAFTLKVGQVLNADRATLFLVDEERGELWSKVAQYDGGKPLEIRTPLTAGIAGHVATTGRAFNIPDAYAEPLFNRDVDLRTGYRTHSILAMPLVNSHNRVFGVVQLLNKKDNAAFDAADEHRLHEFANSMGVILESWWRMSKRSSAAAAPSAPA